MADAQNMMGDMMQQILQQRMAAPTQEQRQGALQKYTEAVQTPVDERQPWEVMLQSSLRAKDPLNPYQAASSMFKGLDDWKNTQREAQYKQRVMAAKLEYDDLLSRQKTFDQEMLPVLKSQLRATTAGTGKFVPVPGVPGLMVNNLDPTKTLDMRDAATRKQVQELASKNRDLYDTDEDAVQAALNMVSQIAAGTPQAVKLPQGVAPAATPIPAAQQSDTPNSMSYYPKVPPSVQADRSLEAYELLRSEIARASKDGNRKEVEDLQKEMTLRFPNGKSSVVNTPTTAPVLAAAAPTPQGLPAAPRSDKAKKKMEEGTAGVTGKALGEEHQGLNQTSEAAGSMITQLGMLRDLYSNPNMPEGAQGETIQSIKSSLKSLGFDVGAEVGAADLAKAISDKIALGIRTADGKNLMPGAMTDFEQRILKGMAPGITMTNEGRMALIDMMEQIARTRIRFAEEANKMADANRGILPSEWNARKQRLMKEEMAKLVTKQREIAARFSGAK